ncbi:MAG: TM0106 family RecB-like putative nuclease, partial [Patescibacteria group bacterium]
DVQEPIMRKLQDEGLLRERELELLNARDIVEVNLDDVDEASQRTVELMRQGVQTIYKGVLIYRDWVGRPDVLERVEGKSNFGNYYYVACDIKRSSHLKDEYRFQGAFYAEILERIQGVRPVQGYVLHTNGEIEGYIIDEMLAEFHLTLDSIERILEGEEPPIFLTSSCKQSPYFSECHAHAKACDDLSLLNRLWRSEATALKEAGIPDLSTLALATKQQLQAVSGIAHDRLLFLSQQAKAMKEDRIIKLRNVEFPKIGDIELVVDIESDPLRDIDYLFGVLKVEDGKETYHSFFAKDQDEVKNMWQDFVAFLQKYPQAKIYHYGWYETDVFKKFIVRFGCSDEIEERLVYKAVDVLPVLREAVIFPLPFYSLKDIAKYLGFSWRSADASGLDSVLWFNDYYQNSDKKALQKIVDYNEDDVRATWFLIDWARKQ